MLSVKKFILTYGPIALPSYIAVFVLFVFIGRKFGVKDGLPGDIVLRNDLGETTVFVPFVSSIVGSLAGVLLVKLLGTFSFSRFLPRL